VTEERCALTELVVEQCDHCRAFGKTVTMSATMRPATPSTSGAVILATFEAAPRVGPPIAAMYRGECCECGGDIEEGDTIVGTTDGWAHEGCAS